MFLIFNKSFYLFKQPLVPPCLGPSHFSLRFFTPSSPRKSEGMFVKPNYEVSPKFVYLQRRAKQRESTEGTSESAHEHQNRLQRERRAKQREQPSLCNDALQLFGDGDASAPGRWDCGKMDTIC
jgi:hypothetical protein